MDGSSNMDSGRRDDGSVVAIGTHGPREREVIFDSCVAAGGEALEIDVRMLT